MTLYEAFVSDEDTEVVEVLYKDMSSPAKPAKSDCLFLLLTLTSDSVLCGGPPMRTIALPTSGAKVPIGRASHSSGAREPSTSNAYFAWKSVSSTHGYFFLRDNKVYYEDNASRNLSFVDGKVVLDHPVLLYSGSTLSLCEAGVKLQIWLDAIDQAESRDRDRSIDTVELQADKPEADKPEADKPEAEAQPKKRTNLSAIPKKVTDEGYDSEDCYDYEEYEDEVEELGDEILDELDVDLSDEDVDISVISVTKSSDGTDGVPAVNTDSTTSIVPDSMVDDSISEQPITEASTQNSSTPDVAEPGSRDDDPAVTLFNQEFGSDDDDTNFDSEHQDYVDWDVEDEGFIGDSDEEAFVGMETDLAEAKANHTALTPSALALSARPAALNSSTQVWAGNLGAATLKQPVPQPNTSAAVTASVPASVLAPTIFNQEFGSDDDDTNFDTQHQDYVDGDFEDEGFIGDSDEEVFSGFESDLDTIRKFLPRKNHLINDNGIQKFLDEWYTTTLQNLGDYNEASRLLFRNDITALMHAATVASIDAADIGGLDYSIMDDVLQHCRDLVAKTQAEDSCIDPPEDSVDSVESSSDTDSTDELNTAPSPRSGVDAVDQNATKVDDPKKDDSVTQDSKSAEAPSVLGKHAREDDKTPEPSSNSRKSPVSTDAKALPAIEKADTLDTTAINPKTKIGQPTQPIVPYTPLGCSLPVNPMMLTEQQPMLSVHTPLGCSRPVNSTLLTEALEATASDDQPTSQTPDGRFSKIRRLGSQAGKALGVAAVSSVATVVALALAGDMSA